MKATLIVAMLALLPLIGAAQEKATTTSFAPPEPAPPLVILRTASQQMVLDPALGDTMKLEALDHRIIQSVDMIDQSSETDIYGPSARNGVLVIHFKGDPILVRESFIKISGSRE